MPGAVVGQYRDGVGKIVVARDGDKLQARRVEVDLRARARVEDAGRLMVVLYPERLPGRDVDGLPGGAHQSEAPQRAPPIDVRAKIIIVHAHQELAALGRNNLKPESVIPVRRRFAGLATAAVRFETIVQVVKGAVDVIVARPLAQPRGVGKIVIRGLRLIEYLDWARALIAALHEIVAAGSDVLAA